MNLLVPSMIFSVHGAVSARLLFRQKLESAPEIPARTLRRSVGPKHLRLAGVRPDLRDQDCVRIPPVVLAAARRAPPVARFLPCFIETHQM